MSGKPGDPTGSGALGISQQGVGGGTSSLFLSLFKNKYPR